MTGSGRRYIKFVYLFFRFETFIEIMLKRVVKYITTFCVTCEELKLLLGLEMTTSQSSVVSHKRRHDCFARPDRVRAARRKSEPLHNTTPQLRLLHPAARFGRLSLAWSAEIFQNLIIGHTSTLGTKQKGYDKHTSFKPLLCQVTDCLFRMGRLLQVCVFLARPPRIPPPLGPVPELSIHNLVHAYLHVVDVVPPDNSII